MPKRQILSFVGLLLLVVSCTSINNSKILQVKTKPEKFIAKNIIFMIVDGMGYEHVKASRIFNGQEPLAYEKFSCKSSITTCAFDGADSSGICKSDSAHVTDSAAAATAIATGVKVSNGVISKKLPGEKSDVKSILEMAKNSGKSTGIIATKLISDATPAAFVSHADDREQTDEILSDMFSGAVPNIIFGADNQTHRDAAKRSGTKYTMVHSAIALKELSDKIAAGRSCAAGLCPHIYAGFGSYDMIPEIYKNNSGLPLEITPVTTFTKLDIPHLSQMTDSALNILSKNTEGFFLMVESSMPDMISHYNTQIDGTNKSVTAISALVKEMAEVENTVKVIEKFVANNPDTLVILTADHETGGLVIDEKNTACLGQKMCVPEVRWTSEKYEPTDDSPARHTGVNVPLYATGHGSERYCQEVMNNTQIMTLALAR